MQCLKRSYAERRPPRQEHQSLLERAFSYPWESISPDAIKRSICVPAGVLFRKQHIHTQREGRILHSPRRHNPKKILTFQKRNVRILMRFFKKKLRSLIFCLLPQLPVPSAVQLPLSHPSLLPYSEAPLPDRPSLQPYSHPLRYFLLQAA